MMDFDLVETLRMIAMEERAEFDRVFTAVLLALLAVCLATLAANLFWQYVAPIIGRHYRERGPLATAFVALIILGFVAYGGTKKKIITDFSADANPDSVICTWNETTNTISSVWVQRRIKGATEEKAWENMGSAPGGVRYLAIDGFTLDTDYEYRAVYTYEEEDDE